MRKQFLEVGKIVTTHGIRGELRVQPWCDDASFFCGFETLYLEKGKKAMEVERSYPHKNIVVVKFVGVDTVEQAQKLRNQVVYINRDDAVLDEGCYFHQDLIGLQVVDADDPHRVYGVLSDISETGANDVYHIRDEAGRERYIPAIPDVVVETDLDAGCMRIRPLRGLFDDAD